MSVAHQQLYKTVQANWDFAVAENESQLSLVSMNDVESWRNFYKVTNNKILEIAKQVEKHGTLTSIQEGFLIDLNNKIGNAKRVPSAKLLEANKAKEDVLLSNEMNSSSKSEASIMTSKNTEKSSSKGKWFSRLFKA